MLRESVIHMVLQRKLKRQQVSRRALLSSDIYSVEEVLQHAIDCIEKGKKNRLIGYKEGHVYDVDIEEAFQMTKSIDDYEYEVAGILGTRCEYK